MKNQLSGKLNGTDRVCLHLRNIQKIINKYIKYTIQICPINALNVVACSSRLKLDVFLTFCDLVVIQCRALSP